MNKKKIIILSTIVAVILLACVVLLMFKSNLKFSLNGKSNISIDVNEKFKDQKVTACYGNLFGCKEVKYSVIGKVDNKKLGTYKIKYKVTYKNETKTLTRTVKVVDKTAPKLTINTKEFTVCPNGKTKKYDYKAEDNFDGDLTDKVIVKAEYDKLVFSVKDSSDNVTKKSFIYQKSDTENPTISLNGSDTEYVLIGEGYNEQGVNVSDDCDDTVASKVNTSGSVNPNQPGKYTINYEVTDESGNSAKITRNVVVYQKNVDVMPSEKTIYLTFDDGPGAHTERLLDVLKKYNVKVTFFVTNQYPAYDSMIKRAYDEGHAIGLHSYTHNYSYVYSSVDNYFADLKNISDKVKSLTGVESKLVRFPGGGSNTVSRKYSPGIMSTLANELESRGYKYFDWNVVSGDAGETKSTDQIIYNVTSSLRDSYSIVLQHDVKSYSVDAVEAIIQYGLTHGYHFAPLDVTSPGAHQRINN